MQPFLFHSPERAVHVDPPAQMMTAVFSLSLSLSALQWAMFLLNFSQDFTSLV